MGELMFFDEVIVILAAFARLSTIIVYLCSSVATFKTLSKENFDLPDAKAVSRKKRAVI